MNVPVLGASASESQIQVPFEALAAKSLDLDLAGQRMTFGIPVQDV